MDLQPRPRRTARSLDRSAKQVNSCPVTTKVPKLAEYLTYWLQEIVAPNLAPLTCATYETLTQLYLVPGLGTKRLDKLTVRDVQTWLNKVRTACQCCAKAKTPADSQNRRCCAIGKCCRSVPSLRTVNDLVGAENPVRAV